MTSFDYLRIQYSHDFDVLQVAWLRAVSQAELECGYQQVQAMALRCRASRWLIDARKRPLLPGQGIWLYQTFMPSLYAFFAEPLRVASLQTPQQLIDQVDLQALHSDDQPFRLRLFAEEDEAYKWLHKYLLV